MEKFILNLNGPSLKIPSSISSGSFDYVARYQIIAEVIHQYFGKKNPKNILDVGGLGTFLDKIIDAPLTILDEEATDEDGKETQGDGARMNVEDGAYEVVVTSDTLEHIPKNDRKKFISELVRVSSDLIILCAPFDNSGVPKEEERLQSFYKGINGQPHRWLQEHADYVLPNVEDIKKCFEAAGVTPIVIGQSSLKLWRQLMGINLLANEMGNEEVSKSAIKINKYYNENILFEDFEQQGYRTFFIASKKRNIAYEQNSNKITAEHSLELGALISDFYTTAVSNAEYIPVMRKKVKDLHDTTLIYKDEIQILKDERDQIISSRSWRYTAPLRTAKKKVSNEESSK
ncbi:class I SAM-dependent methyltransferase [bacterium]|nr:class I SAM-dependent methyltransferase [bacterium]NBX98000.1 class I SAM-dependent methyltransferase [bacterium]